MDGTASNDPLSVGWDTQSTACFSAFPSQVSQVLLTLGAMEANHKHDGSFLSRPSTQPSLPVRRTRTSYYSAGVPVPRLPRDFGHSVYRRPLACGDAAGFEVGRGHQSRGLRPFCPIMGCV